MLLYNFWQGRKSKTALFHWLERTLFFFVSPGNQALNCGLANDT
jgi:hypothetical protein